MHTPSRRTRATVLVSLILLGSIAAVGGVLTRSPQAEAAITARQAWALLNQASRYEFSTTVEQTTYPAPAISNVGRSSQTETYYVSGKTDLQTGYLDASLWQNDGSLLSQDGRLDIHVEDGKATGRINGGAWEELKDFSTSSFASQSNTSAFLTAAREVSFESAETVAWPQADGTTSEMMVRRYHFTVDPRQYAEVMRDQMVAELQQSGKLPLGMKLSASDRFRGMIASGDIWIDADGLPVRMTVEMEMPPEKNGERVDARITTDFFNHARENLLAARPLPLRLAGALGLPVTPEGFNRLVLAVGLGGLFAALMLLLVFNAHRRQVYAGVAVLVVASMLFSPLWQGDKALAFASDMRAQQSRYEAEQEQAQAQREQNLNLSTSDWDPHTAPIEQVAPVEERVEETSTWLAPSTDLALSGRSRPAASESTEPAADWDQDGLTDAYEQDINTYAALNEEILDWQDADTDDDGLNDGVEVKLNLFPGEADTDGDRINDTREVRYFVYNSLDWYSNPEERDTDHDGRLDGAECYARVASADGVCADTDSDGIPDIFDTDDDNDGVASIIDASPTAASPDTFSAANPLKLSVSNLGADKPVFITYQLRPTNPKHLTYTLNVLDWPTGDTDGQIQRLSDTTFADQMPEQLAADPRADYGDLRLLPMVEIKLTGTTLPLPLTDTLSFDFASGAFTGTFTLKGVPAAGQAASHTDVTLTDGPAGMTYALYHGAGTCDVFTRGEKIGDLAKGSTGTLPVSLGTLADGGHVIYAMDANATVTSCASIPPTAHGTQTDVVVDTEALLAYGGVARNDTDGAVLVYAPLALVRDFDGNVPTAFFAKVPFTNTGDRFSGSSQEVRVIWLLNMLTDVCKPMETSYDEEADGKWCDPTKKAERYDLDVSRIVQTYGDEFKLTGLTVQEDHGVDMAVVYENPLTDPDPGYDDPLWVLSRGLEGSFASGRADMTVAEIQHRFDPDYNDDIPDMAPPNQDHRMWGQAHDAFQVERYSYPTADGVYDFMSTQVQTLFSSAFSNLPAGKNVDSATLLFARTLSERAVSYGEPAATCTGGTCAFDFNGKDVMTQAVLNWAPYRRAENAWESYPLEEYLDHFEARLRADESYRPADASTDAKYLVDGQIYMARMYYESFYRGIATLTALNGSPITNIESVLDDQNIDNSFYQTNGRFQAINKVFKSVTEALIAGMEKNANLLTSGMGLKQGTAGFFKAVGEGYGDKLGNLAKKLGPALTRAAVAVAIAIVIVIAAGLIMYLADPDGSVGKTGLRMLMTGLSLLSAGLAIGALASAWAAYRAGEAVSKAAKGAAMVGLVIGLVITWGVFFGMWASSGLEAGSLALNSMAADAIAATITIVLMAALACTGVGAVIVAAIALIDALIMAICAAAGVYEEDEDNFYRQYVCIGISGWVTKIIKWFIYSQTFIIDYDNEERLEFGNLDQDVQDPYKGMSTGNNMSITLDVTNTITGSDVPLDWKAAMFWWQYGDTYVKSSTFAYKVQPTEAGIHGGLERYEMSSQWAAVPGNDDKWSHEFEAKTDGHSIVMPQPGINRDPTAYVTEGSAVPVQECFIVPMPFSPTGFIPICYLRTERASFSVPLGDSLTVDVFPPSLDAFYTLTETGRGGYSLAWGRDQAKTFPTFKDADGDGLISTAHPGGTDPNDSLFDTDNDGLEDGFEINQGTDPTMFDTDDDGLYDVDEFRLGTSPTRKDTDGDGLPDKDEADGWLYTYDFTATGAPLETMVYPDPFTPDTDFDGLTDLLERIYGFNPRVPDKADVLNYELSLREADAPLVMLRFDEEPGSTVFADSSNFGFSGGCDGICPLSGLDGRFGRAIQLDGSDAVTVTNSAGRISFAGTPFTLAAWVYLANGSNGGTVISKWGAGAGEQEVLLEVTADGKLRLSSSGGSLTGSGAIPFETWTHVAASFDGAQARLYVDGGLDGSSGWTGSAAITGSDVMIGGYGGAPAAEYFDGRLDEAAIFTRALSGDEIADRLMVGRYNFNDTLVRPGEEVTYHSLVENLLNSRFAYGLLTTVIDWKEAIVDWATKLLPQTFVLYPDNPVVTEVNWDDLTETLQINPAVTESGDLTITQTVAAQIVDRRTESNMAELWLKLDEAGGATSFEDFSGNMPPRPGTCTTCPTSGLTDSVLNNAVRFNANAGAKLTLPTLETLRMVNRGYTISLWVKPAAPSGAGQVVDLITTTGSPFRLYLESTAQGNYLPRVMVNNALVAMTPWRRVEANAWTHLAVEYDLTTLTVYVNGAAVATASSVAAIATSAAAYLGETMPVNTLVDDLRIFSRPLSVVDINRLAELPVLKLEMDGSSYSAVSDSSKYGQAVGIGTGFLWPARTANSIRGQAMTPGSGSSQAYLRVTGNSLLNMQDGAFTFSVWIYPKAEGEDQWQGVFGHNSGEASAYPTLERKGSILRFAFGDGTAFQSRQSPSVLSASQWNHVVVTFQPSTGQAGVYEYKLYVNGLVRDSFLFNTKPTSASTFFVGHSSTKYTATANYFHVSSHDDPGSAAEVKWYKNGSGIWGRGDVYSGDDYTINNSETFYNHESVTYSCDEDDSWPNPDDGCGSHSLYWYLWPGSYTGHCSDGFNGTLYMSVSKPSTEFRGSIDMLEVYRYAIDTEQVYDLYNSIPITARLPLDDRPSSNSFENLAFIGDQDNGNCTDPNCPAAGTVGLINQATRFDGGNDQITVNVNTTSDYMVSLWTNTLCESCGLYSLTSGGSAIQQVYLQNGNACAVTGTSRLCTRGGEIADGEWHHLAYANNGSTTTLWVDGEIANSITGGSAVPAAPSGQAVLGYAPDADQDTLNGQLDDVRVFRYSQAAEVVAQLKQRAPLFFAHLDETATEAGMEDATPMDWRLTCSGNQCPDADKEGRLGRSMEFDGAGDALALEQAMFSDTTQSFTASIWVMPTQKHAAAQTLWTLATPDNSAVRYSVALAPNSLKVCVLAGPAATCTGQSYVDLVLNSWNFVTLTVERKTSTVEQYSLYINGYLDSTGIGSSGAGVVNGLGQLTVGNKPAAQAQAGGAFGGRIDEPAVYEYLFNEIDVRETFHYQMAQVEERESLTLTIDADSPTAELTSFNPDFPYIPGPDQLMHIQASDPTSEIALVELTATKGADSTQVTAPACLDSTSGSSFCPTFEPEFGNGAYDLSLRAVDQVGNQYQSAQPYRIYVDDVKPRIVTDQKENPIKLMAAKPHRSKERTWTLHLSGSAGDPVQSDGSTGSGVDPESVRVSVRSEAGEVIGMGTVIPELTQTATGYTWQVDYLFPEVEPTGKLTIVVEAADKAGNTATETADILLDATPSTAKLNQVTLPQGEGPALTIAASDPSPVLIEEDELSGSVSDVPEDQAPYMTENGKGAAVGISGVQVGFKPSADASYLFNEPYPDGLLAWLPLDSDTVPFGPHGDPDPSLPQRTFLDISPYQIAGVCSGAHCPQAGPTGHKGGSIYFNGQEQMINLGQQVDLAERSFTVSVWAKRDVVGENHPLLWQGPLSISDQRFLFGLGADNRLACGFGGTDLLSTQAYTDTDWHHWACSYDRTSGKRTLYRDGVAVASDTSAPVEVMNENLYAGLAPVGGFQGYLDELVILDHALTDGQVRDQYTGYNTVFHLTVDEVFLAHGATVRDRAGYFQTGVLDSGPDDPNNKVTPGVVGDFALAFDGNDRLIVQPAYSLRLDRGAFTQTAWIYPTGSGEQDVISQRDGNPEQRYPSISVTGDYKLKAGFGDGFGWNGVETTNAVITPNAWNFVAVTYDGKTYSLYVNGGLVLETDDLAGRMPYPVDHFTVGDGFAGSIDDVRIYTRALSELEIGSMAGLGWYGATLGGSGSETTWTAPVMEGLEGPYQIDVRSWDTEGHYAYGKQVVNQWGGLVDTLAPRFTAHREPIDPENPFLMRYTFVIEDTLLDEDSIRQNICPEAEIERDYYNSSWYLASGVAPNTTLYRLRGTCETEEGTTEEVGIFACDTGGHCAFQLWPAELKEKVFLPVVSGGIGTGGPSQPTPQGDIEAVRERAQGWPSLQETLTGEDPGQAPVVEILTATVGPEDVRNLMIANLKGRVSDDGVIAWMQIRVLRGEEVVYTGPASVYGEIWNAPWIFEAGSPPADGTYTLEVSAADRAGHPATIRQDIHVQLAP